MKKQKFKFLEREYTLADAQSKIQQVVPDIQFEDADDLKDFVSDVAKTQPRLFATLVKAFRGHPSEEKAGGTAT